MKNLFLSLFAICIFAVNGINAQCTYSVNLHDSYGDGWNGGYIVVYVNGTTAISYAEGSGYGPSTYTFNVNTGDLISISYFPGGWSYENYYYVYDSEGNQVYSSGGPPPGTVNLTASCPSCIKPLSLDATNFTYNSVDLTWIPSSTGSLWNVEWGENGFTPGTGTLVTGLNTTAYSLTGLAEDTYYSYYVQTDCGAGDLSTWAGPYTFLTPPSCFQPGWQNVTATTYESANLEWEAIGSLYNIEWGNWGFTQGTGTLVTGLNSNNYNLTGLNEETEYGYYVQTDCGGGDVSYWTGPYYFYTPVSCVQPSWQNVTDITDASATLQWNEPSAGLLYNIEWGNAGFTVGTGNLVTGITSGSYNLTSLSSATDYSFYVQTDCGSGDLSYWSGPYDFATSLCAPADACDYTINMYDSYGDGWNGGYLSFYQNGVHAGDASLGWGYSATATISLCHDANIEVYWYPGSWAGEASFNMTHPWDNDILCSFSNGGAVPPNPFCTFTADCIPPTCPGPANLSVENVLGYSADITWQETGPASLWNVEWGPAGFTPGTGTLVSGLTATTYSLTGLTPVTGYDFYVQSDCTLGDLSEWEGPYFFASNVSCPAPTNFHATYYDADEAQLTWTTGSSEHWNLEYGPAGFTPGTGTMLLDVTNPVTITGLSPETAYDFYVQDTCNVADLSAWVYLYLVTPAACPVPIDIVEESISFDQAVFSWNGFDATEWDIEFGVSPLIFTGTPTIENATDNPFTFTGLTQSTNYQFYIRSDCGSETSGWSGPWSFATLESPITNPSACELNYNISSNNCYDVPVVVEGVSGSSMGSDIRLNEVKLIVKHTYAADLDITLESPEGIVVELTSDNGGSGDNYGLSDGTCTQSTIFTRCAETPVTSGVAPFVGPYVPQGDFDDFNDGSDPNGLWIIHICDDKAGDVGKFNFLELVFGNENTEANILSFSIPEQASPAIINDTENTVEIEVGFSADMANLTPSFSLSSCAIARIGGTDQQSGVTVNDFTSPVLYDIYAEDGTMETWTVTATQLPVNSETDILTYSFPEQASEAVIDYGLHEVVVSVNYDADIYNLFADFTLSYGATAQVSGVDQISGVTPNDFSSYVTYTVTAEDGVTTQDWTIIVGLLDPPQGALCENPIPLNLPAINIAGTTDGFGDDYGSDYGFNPCGSNYLNGNDIVYQIEIDNIGVLVGDLTTPNSYAGMFIFDGCPDDPATNCIYSVNSPTSGFNFTNVPIDPGTYFVIISSWPSPQFIDFQFNLMFLNNALDAEAQMPQELEEICNDEMTSEISMYIVNSGTDVIPAGDTIYPAYQFDGGAINAEMLILESDLNPFDSLLYVFDGTVDISVPGTYPISLWFDYDNDEIAGNNLVESFITSIDLSVEIGNGDAIEVIMADFPIDLYLIDSYQFVYWHNNDLSQTGVNEVFTISDFGWYFVEVSDNEGCFATDSIYVGFTVGVDENDLAGGLLVYPNPGNGFFNTSIKLPETSDVFLSVRNAQGQLLLTTSAKDVLDYKTMIDISSYAPGIYYLEVRTNKDILVKKLVKQ